MNENTSESAVKKRLRQSSLMESFGKQKYKRMDNDGGGLESAREATEPFRIGSFEDTVEEENEKVDDAHNGGDDDELDYTSLYFSSIEASSQQIPLFDGATDALVKKPDPDEIEILESPLSLGTSLDEMNRNPDCALALPQLSSDENHTVLFDPNSSFKIAPQPVPESFVDAWDNNVVRLPCSPQNMYPGENGTLESRWELIKRSLNENLMSSYDLEEAILSYNTRYSQRWCFKGLHEFFLNVLDEAEKAEFFGTTLPKMVQLALELPSICTQPIPLLKLGMNHTITLSQKQAACLLANAFFCTFPRRNYLGKGSEYETYPGINFNGLYSLGNKRGVVSRKTQKLKCVIHYFKRVTTEEPIGSVSFTKRCLNQFPDWDNSSKKFVKLHVASEGTIERDGVGMLQVDFANRFVGGGVLGWGCVQEEIRFVICPELILSRLFTEKLQGKECLVVTGCEQFSSYKGYADSFEWDGDYIDVIPRDAWGRKYTQVLAIDATPFRKREVQYYTRWLEREVNKAYCGFCNPDVPAVYLTAVATGNWGCGVYNGDSRLKFLIQLCAAAEAGRDLVYFTFGDDRNCKEMYDVHKFLIAKQITIGELWKVVKRYHDMCFNNGKPSRLLYDFLYSNLTAYDSDTDVEDCGAYINFN